MTTKSESNGFDAVPVGGETRAFDSGEVQGEENRPPARLGRYVVLNEIGRGGMGVVWTAYDPKLDRKVAIKLLKKSSRTMTRQARFIREAQALARLSHPNIVTVHDVDTHGGQLYMAMEYVAGQTLEHWLMQDAGWRDIIGALVEAGQGLAAAHAAGITHRDFKPSNVLVSDEGRVKVLDFGLAKHMDRGSGDDEEEDSRRLALLSSEEPEFTDGDAKLMEMIGSSTYAKLTMRGRFVGTPAYMAPEQFTLPDSHEIGAWSDQFGFGVTLYEALYDQMPFAGDSAFQIYENAKNGRILEPSRSSAVPSWVFRVLQRSLQYKPGDRYPSMKALLEALRADPAKRRRRISAIVGGGVLSILIVFGVLWAVFDQPPPCQGARDRLAGVWDDAARTAVEEGLTQTDRPFAADTATRVTTSLDRYADAWVEQHTAICEATQIHGEQSEALLDVRMTCLDRRSSELGALARVLENPEEDTVAVAVAAAADLRRPEPCATAQPGVESEVPSDPDERVAFLDLQTQLDDASAMLAAGRHLAARDLAAAAAEKADEAGFRRLLASALVIEGGARKELNDLDVAQQRLREGITVATEVADVRTEFLGWNDLLYIAGVLLDRPQQAADWQFASESALHRTSSSKDLDFKLALTTSAVMVELDELEEAARHGEEALRIARDMRGPRSLQHAQALTNLAVVAGKRSDWTLAKDRLRQSYDVKQEVLGPNHPEVVSNALNLANALAQYAKGADTPEDARKAYEEAERLYVEVMSAREQIDGPSSKGVAQSLIMLGLLQINQNKLDEARRTYERALNLSRALPEAQGDLADALTNLGKLERLEQDYLAAEGYYREALELQRERYGDGHVRVGRLHLYLCQVLRDAGRHRSALAECKQVISMFESDSDGIALPLLLTAYGFSALCSDQLGRMASATEYRAREAELKRRINTAKKP